MIVLFASTDTMPLVENLQLLIDDIMNGRGAYSLDIWGMPLLLLLVGLFLGVGLAVWLTNDRRAAKQISAAGRRTDLRQQRNTVIDALHALDMERDKIPEQDYLRERKALLAFGANAMRDLEDPMTDSTDELRAALETQRDQLGAERMRAIEGLIAGGPLPTKPTTPMIPPVWVGVLATLTGVALLGAIALGVSVKAPPTLADVATVRAPVRPQQSARPPQAPPQPMAVTPQEIEWQKKVEADPTDMDSLDALTNGAIRREDWKYARKYNKMALAADSTDASARTYEALLTYQAGGYPQAIEMLDAVIESSPKYSRARELRGIVHMQIGQFDEAVVQLEAAMELNDDPERKSRLQMMIGQAKQAAAQAKVANVPELGGSIHLDGYELPAGATLYISVTQPGMPRPLRAKKLTGPFPTDFTLVAADAPMGGGPLPESVTVSLKVDLDGNPMGNDPGAPPKVVIKDVKPGTLDMKLVLKP